MQKTQIVLLTLIALAMYAGGYLLLNKGPAKLQAFESVEATVYQSYQQWKSEHGVNTNGSEDAAKFSVYRENYFLVQQQNALNDGLTLKLNQFATQTNEEFGKINFNYIATPASFQLETEQYSDNALPTSVDWVKKGAVVAPMQQGSCGGCWAFGTTAGLEALNQQTNNNLVSLSQQQLLSCAPPLPDYPKQSGGCKGSNNNWALTYTAEKGVESQASYPYVNGGTNTTVKPCKYDASKVVFKNKGQSAVPSKNVNALKTFVSQHVVSIGINGASFAMQFYGGGIIKKNCSAQLDHSVAIVGYNTEGETPYWTIKNSWGSGWGNGGYGQILISEGDGVCGINLDGVVPTI